MWCLFKQEKWRKGLGYWQLSFFMRNTVFCEVIVVMKDNVCMPTFIYCVYIYMHKYANTVYILYINLIK